MFDNENLESVARGGSFDLTGTTAKTIMQFFAHIF